MEKKSRRDFFKQATKGVVIGLLGFFPGSFFNRKTTFAATRLRSMGDDTLESVLKRVTKDNLYTELNAASLSSEEKLAIASVKEVPSRELLKTIDEIRNEGSVMGAGHVCGSGCGGSCGHTCGDSCSAPSDALSVVDRKGRLNIDIKRINKSRFLTAVEKAINIIK